MGAPPPSRRPATARRRPAGTPRLTSYNPCRVAIRDLPPPVPNPRHSIRATPGHDDGELREARADLRRVGHGLDVARRRVHGRRDFQDQTDAAGSGVPIRPGLRGEVIIFAQRGLVVHLPADFILGRSQDCGVRIMRRVIRRVRGSYASPHTLSDSGEYSTKAQARLGALRRTRAVLISARGISARTPPRVCEPRVVVRRIARSLDMFAWFRRARRLGPLSNELMGAARESTPREQRAVGKNRLDLA